MIIKQIFTEPETEVKWYFDCIEENSHVYYVRNRLMPMTHAPETGTENPYQKSGTSFVVPVFRTR